MQTCLTLSRMATGMPEFACPTWCGPRQLLKIRQTSRAKIATDSVVETAGRGVTLEHDPLRDRPEFPELLG